MLPGSIFAARQHRSHLGHKYVGRLVSGWQQRAASASFQNHPLHWAKALHLLQAS
jgi:hypothetical protein